MDTPQASREAPLLKITSEDIAAANRLSLHCPICASPVERNGATAAEKPVACRACDTLYHHACWGLKGGKCAMLGCDHTECYPYGERVGSILTIRTSDLPRDGGLARANGRLQRLKEEQRRLRDAESGPIWSLLWRRLLRAIRL